MLDNLLVAWRPFLPALLQYICSLFVYSDNAPSHCSPSCYTLLFSPPSIIPSSITPSLITPSHDLVLLRPTPFQDLVLIHPQHKCFSYHFPPLTPHAPSPIPLSLSFRCCWALRWIVLDFLLQKYSLFIMSYPRRENLDGINASQLAKLKK